VSLGSDIKLLSIEQRRNMFEELASIGKSFAGDDTEPFELLSEYVGDNYSYGISIDFSENGEKFLGVDYEEYNTSRLKKVVYRKGAPNGFDPTGVSKMSAAVEKAIIRLSRYCDAISETKEEKLFTNLSNHFKEQSDIIEEKVKAVYDSLDITKEKNAFFYLKIDDEPIYRIKAAKDFFVEKMMEDFAKKGDFDVFADNRTCSICNNKDSSVFGNMSSISCYHLNEFAQIAGGCHPSQGVKNFPICTDCAILINRGFEELKSRMSFYMAGMTYLLLPVTDDVKLIKKLIDALSDDENISLHKKTIEDQTGKDKVIQRLLTKNDAQLRKIGVEFGNTQLTMRMIFYEADKQKWRIVGEIPRVLPSRISKIYCAKKDAEDEEFYAESDYVSMREIMSMADYSPAGKSNIGKRKFLEYAAAIFGGQKTMSYHNVLHDIVSYVRRAYRKDDYASSSARKAFMLLNFLGFLGIIDKKKGDRMETEDRIDGFFSEYSDFFGTAEKKVAFMTGMLINRVVGWGPSTKIFLKKLGDYRFDREKLLRLRPIIEHKLAQYDREKNSLLYTRDLRHRLDMSWAESGEKWQSTDDELTLATIMGMNLQYHLTSKKEDDSQGELEEETE